MLGVVQVKTEADGSLTWTCEFCGGVTKDIDTHELPTSDDLWYLLTPAPAEGQEEAKTESRSMVVFCVGTQSLMRPVSCCR